MNDLLFILNPSHNTKFIVLYQQFMFTLKINDMKIL